MSVLTAINYYKTNVNDEIKKENEELKKHLECEEDGYPCSGWFSDKLDFHIKYHFCNEGGEYYECLKDLKEKPNCLDDLIFGSVQRMKEENEKLKDMIENFRKESKNSVCVDEDVVKYIYEDWDNEKINKCIEDNANGICSYLYDKMKEVISDDLEEWGNKYDKEKYGVCDCCDDILYENIPIFIWEKDEKEVTICKECSDDCEEGYREEGWICDEDEE
jgi:hypothetical protein